MSLGLGDFDKDSVHNLNTNGKKAPFFRPSGGNRDGGFPFPTDYSDLDNGSDVYVEDEDALENVITATIVNLSEEDKQKALRAYYRDVLRSESVKQKLAERKLKMETRARMHQWVKYLLVVVTTLLLISLVAVVVTIIYTSIVSGSISETGIAGAIVSFFSEIVRMLLLGG